MKIKIYQVDAFADRLFAGNPAAVCPLDEWLPDEIMRQVAMENNLAETAFYVRKNDQFEIRWFTPEVEVDLCGHATLASAFVLFNYENFKGDVVSFYSPRSGRLEVTKDHDRLTLDFPADVFEEIPSTKDITACFNFSPLKVFKGKTDVMLVFSNENDIINLKPDLNQIRKLNARGVIVTAKGNNVDFVSRFFAPQSGIDEDPVTGSAHTTLTPYWSEQLNKNSLTAIQLSGRRGYLNCSMNGGRVLISGTCKLYLTGEIFLE